MEDYVDLPYPSKAGVYAVRGGPFIAQNLVNYLSGKPLEKYVPQTAFIALMMTGDRSCIGSRFGMTFVGDWVWELKDHIDYGFMDLFNPAYLFEDYKEHGTFTKPVENFQLYEDNVAKNKEVADRLAAEAKLMTSEEAGAVLSSPEADKEFLLKW